MIHAYEENGRCLQHIIEKENETASHKLSSNDNSMIWIQRLKVKGRGRWMVAAYLSEHHAPLLEVQAGRFQLHGHDLFGLLLCNVSVQIRLKL